MPSSPPEQHAPPTHIKEVAETNILQITQVLQEQSTSQGQYEDEDLDIFQVFAAEKRKCENRAPKVPELTVPPQMDQPDTTNAHATCPPPQYRYHSSAKDQQLVTELHSWMMEGKLSLTTPTHILAASPTIRRELVEKLKVQRVETNVYEGTQDPTGKDASTPTPNLPCKTEHSLPLLELDVLVGNQVTVPGVLDPRSQIVVIRRDLADRVNAQINANHQVQMEGANRATNWMVGCAEHLTMQVGGVPFKIHAHVVDNAPFELLLGRPFG